MSSLESMLMFYNIRTCIGMLMKKMSLAGNPFMCMSMQRQNASLMQINEFFRQAILPTPFLSAGESHLPGNRQRGQPPANFFLPEATTTILLEATFESGMGVPKSQWRGFLMHKSQVTNMDGQEMNFIWLGVGDDVPSSLLDFLLERCHCD